MHAVLSAIRRRPIVSFYLLNFAITWGLGFSFPAVLLEEQFLLAPLVAVALCGPALAGMAVSAAEDRGSAPGPRRGRWLWFIALLLLGTAVFIANNVLLNGAPLTWEQGLLSLVLFAPPVAFVLSAAQSRNMAVRDMLASLRRRPPWRWLAVAVTLLPLLTLAAALLSRALDRAGGPLLGGYDPGLGLLALVGVKFAYQMFFFNLAGEEIGWSGFARPRLQAHFSPLLTAVIVAFFWGPWHFFLWQAEGQDVLSGEYWLIEALTLLPAAILIGWLYNRSGGNVLVAGAAHAAGNTAMFFLAGIDWQVLVGLMLTVALLLVRGDGMWRRLPSAHAAVHVAGGSVADESGQPRPAI